MDVNQLGTLALVVVVAAIIISMGGSILASMQGNLCDSDGNSWDVWNSTPPEACCSKINGTVASECLIYVTSASGGFNATNSGLSAMSTFSAWIPLLALVVVASIVIGVIVKYMGGAGGV